MLEDTRSLSRRRRREAKQFQCKGFGDCNMIFSRSEHLARHARKHTGEKPYKCIVVNCDRTFSRIDNMMQHTNTHYRNKKSMHLSDKPSDSGSESTATTHAPPPSSPNTQFQPFHPPGLIPSPVYDPRLAQEHYPYYPPVFVPSAGVYPLWPYPSPNTSPLPFDPQKNPDFAFRQTLIQNMKDARLVDLTTPIQHISHTPKDVTSALSTAVTAAEFEALQGFGQFCAKPREYKQVPVRLQFSHIHSFRQHLHLVQESFQRNSHFG
ncbi:hypothetical protein BY458DRAFT_508376 [Sporodiniella umbellata]|nr:hypothetical protein BY458DRAFT_508376 [Sporodiniella umbellata]